MEEEVMNSGIHNNTIILTVIHGGTKPCLMKNAMKIMHDENKNA
jgi:hypothetical protein